MAQEVQQITPTHSISWRRWFRRTNVYIAEYIMMLVVVGIFLGLLVSLWFSFFQMIMNDSYSGRIVATTAASAIAALLIVAPAAYWLYARVTGQEMIDNAVQTSKARTVFLTMWMIVICLATIGVGISFVSGITGAIFGLGDGGETIVTMSIPALFAGATLGFGLFMVVKRVSRKFVMTAGIVLASTALLLILANSIMIFVRKDASPRPTINTPSTSCSYSDYLNEDCTYSEYRQQSSSNR